MFYQTFLFFLLLFISSCGKNETERPLEIKSIKPNESYLLVVQASPLYSSYAVGIVTKDEGKPKIFFSSSSEVIAQCLGNNILIAQRYRNDSLALYQSKSLAKPKWQVSTIFNSLGGGSSNIQSIESWSSKQVVLSSLDYSYLLFLNLADGSLNTSLTKRNNFSQLDEDRTPDLVASRWFGEKFYILSGNYNRSRAAWSFGAPHLISFDQNGKQQKIKLTTIINPHKKMIAYGDKLLIAGQGNLMSSDFSHAGIVMIDEHFNEKIILQGRSIWDWVIDGDDIIFISYLNWDEQELIRFNLMTNESKVIGKGKFSSLTIDGSDLVVANSRMDRPSLDRYSLTNYAKISSTELNLIPQQVIFCQN